MNPIVVNIPGARILSSSGSGSNGRQHWTAKSGEVQEHRSGANVAVVKEISKRIGYRAEVLRWAKNGPVLIARSYVFASDPKPGAYPARCVTLTRIHPKGRAIRDDDNLPTAFKPTRDGVADALGVNDSVFINVTNGGNIPPGRIGVVYNQIVGPWGIRITIETQCT